MRALWSDRPSCSHNVSQKVKRIRRLSDFSLRQMTGCGQMGVKLIIGGGGSKIVVGEGSYGMVCSLIFFSLLFGWDEGRENHKNKEFNSCRTPESLRKN